VWDGRDKVMSNVVVRNVVQEETANWTKERSINGGDSSTDERPGVFAEMRHSGIRVVKVSQHDDPMVCEEVRNRVEFDDGRDVRPFDPCVDDGSHGEEAQIREYDLPSLFLFEESAVRRVVVRPCRVHGVSKGVVQEVSLHAYGLHEDDAKKGKDGGFFEHLPVVLLCDTLWVPEFEVGTGWRDKVLIAFDRSRGFVVEMVGVAPGEVRNKKEGVEDEPNEVVDPGMARDNTVTSLMTQSPHSGPGNSSPVPVRSP